MKPAVPDKEQAIQYLLGEMSARDRITFEEACFENDEMFEELLAVEAELTDDYVRGELVGRRREQFEQRLLNSPDRTAELELSRLITRREQRPSVSSIEASRKESSPLQALMGWLGVHRQLVRVTFAMATILLLGICLGLILLRSRQMSRPSPEQMARESSSPTVTPQENGNSRAPETSSLPTPTPGHRDHTAASPSKTPQDARPRAVIVMATLTSGFEREQGEVNDIHIPRGAERVRFKINLAANGYESYRASLKRIESEEILSSGPLKARPTSKGRSLTFDVPASALPAGDYMVTITGAGSQPHDEEVVGRYFVRTHRR